MNLRRRNTKTTPADVTASIDALTLSLLAGTDSKLAPRK